MFAPSKRENPAVPLKTVALALLGMQQTQTFAKSDQDSTALAVAFS
jgi:phage tail sheath gpL-like